MKRLITLLLLIVFVAATPATVSAQQYGQGTVLGDETPETKGGKPLPATGLAEDVAVAGGILGIGAAYYVYKSKSKRSVSFK